MDKNAVEIGIIIDAFLCSFVIDIGILSCNLVFMVQPINIETEATKKINSLAELELLRSAVGQKAGSAALRLRLARLLNKLDLFAETIELLAQTHPANETLGAKFALISAYFAQNTAQDNALAKQTAESAIPLVHTDYDRSHVFAELAKAHLRLDENDAAMVLLWDALDLDPANVSAFKRLVHELLYRKQPQKVIALTDGLKQKGVNHSRLLAARMMAFAASSESAAAKELLGAKQFVYTAPIQKPAGWLDLAAFNAAIATEISSNPGMRFERYGTSSQRAWRVDHPATGDTPAIAALLTEIARIAEGHAAACAKHNHAWPNACPHSAILRSWCVMTEGDGYEKWHMHPDGWMSGGYYVEVPDSVANGSDDAGCLALGVPGWLIGEDAAQKVQQTQVRPKPGLLTLFPSYAYHRTFPHKGQGRRMCIAFDICPV